MIIKALKAILAYYALKMLIWSRGKETVATAEKAGAGTSKRSPPK